MGDRDFDVYGGGGGDDLFHTDLDAKVGHTAYSFLTANGWFVFAAVVCVVFGFSYFVAARDAYVERSKLAAATAHTRTRPFDERRRRAVERQQAIFQKSAKEYEKKEEERKRQMKIKRQEALKNGTSYRDNGGPSYRGAGSARPSSEPAPRRNWGADRQKRSRGG